jgi:hypothetical protein
VLSDELKIGIGINEAAIALSVSGYRYRASQDFLTADTEAMDGVRCASEYECEAQITGSGLHYADKRRFFIIFAGEGLATSRNQRFI